jgi:hypothetical protein
MGLINRKMGEMGEIGEMRKMEEMGEMGEMRNKIFSQSPSPILNA